jgi:recombination protein RecA
MLERIKGENMPSAAALRSQIELSLERRFPAALTPVARTYRETAPTGIDSVDRLLEGGLPVGAISEITGPESSGRTSLALAYLAGMTREDRVVAWVDAADTLDAESAAASGVDLKRLLWVRCRAAKPSPDKKPERPQLRVQQAAKPWTRLDQALRATDLLLQAGGFSALVLDLGSIAPEHGTRIPLATWFRYRQAADRTRCSLLVLAQQQLAQSSAAVVLDCAPLRAEAVSPTVLNGFSYQVRSGRQRFAPARGAQSLGGPSLGPQRKPPASTWSAAGTWQSEECA